MNFLSVCSGIEAASVAWVPLGWKAVAFSEIEPFPCAVLAHHYPDTPNWGDMTKYKDWPDVSIDLLCGGTPCQSFSVAGLRKGLDDPRGNLMLTFSAIAAKYRPQWLVWENVPGVLSSNGGADFGAFLGMLGQLGYGFAYRVLDAKYFGIPQQRRRVFVIGCYGDWRSAAAVLFERSSLFGVSPTPRSNPVSDVDWWAGEGRVLNCIDAGYGAKWGSNQWYASGHVIIDRTGRARRATILEVERCFGFPDGYTEVPYTTVRRGAARAKPVHPLQDDSGGLSPDAGEAERRLRAVQRADGAAGGRSLPLNGQGARDSLPSMQYQTSGDRGYGLGDAGLGVPGRRPVTPDSHRYKALGNSWAVPNVRWIGTRINAVNTITALRKAA